MALRAGAILCKPAHCNGFDRQYLLVCGACRLHFERSDRFSALQAAAEHLSECKGATITATDRRAGTTEEWNRLNG